MKVLLINGSPHEKGCTYTALCQVAEPLHQAGVETDFFWLGREPISGCRGCRACFTLHRCVFDDAVNAFTELAAQYDGFVFGSPVHYSGISGEMKSFMDRVFYSAAQKEVNPFLFKPAAAIVSARRAGTTAALDQLNKYLLYNQMLVPGSRYWNMVHGNAPEEVLRDEEGLQIMRVLGRNLAWLLQLKAAGAAAGVPLPEVEPRIFTNFIR